MANPVERKPPEMNFDQTHSDVCEKEIATKAMKALLKLSLSHWKSHSPFVLLN